MPKAPATPAPAAEESPSAAPDAAPARSFETALAELEKLVARMESGSLSLEQSLAAHQRGLALAKFCQGLLARAEQQVKVLEEDMLRAFPANGVADDDAADAQAGDEDASR